MSKKTKRKWVSAEFIGVLYSYGQTAALYKYTDVNDDDMYCLQSNYLSFDRTSDNVGVLYNCFRLLATNMWRELSSTKQKERALVGAELWLMDEKMNKGGVGK
jgi:hypothetical protein